ncbi:E3 ubiquitin-protein ligase [Tetrabaena socialis]|uniref:E3 ubiquitin-protein ligase n=1 Tax=Tetrabaena socialis TaxID=47790 RepID=A0A2J8AB54_9CHLO|nr:E3 ubiquitin-protein ligase [Tetrabaena socialis]|eukprot:PNH09748.1 E3 ubiquitin-protein ligase [Tetrabaena socialis]
MQVCRKPRIHPYDAHAAAEHLAACQLRHDRLEARLRSADVECGICLEAVLSKASVSEQRFGLLACDHAFCLSCIRSWRQRNTDETLATDTAVRTCPICRTPTHYVTPSLVWPATSEDKEAILSAYKLKLSTIDCRNFDHGDGTCAFGTSCMYRHMYRDGRLEEVVLRRAGNADGDVRVVMPVQLSAFFQTPQAQRLLSRRRD